MLECRKKNGNKDIKCSMCREKEETVAHICECEEVEKLKQQARRGP